MQEEDSSEAHILGEHVHSDREGSAALVSDFMHIHTSSIGEKNKSPTNSELVIPLLVQKVNAATA